MSTTSTPRIPQWAQGAVILGIWALCALVLIDAFTTKYLWGQIVAGTEFAYSASEVATAQSVTFTEHFQPIYQQGLLKYSLALRYIIWGISMFIAALGFIAATATLTPLCRRHLKIMPCSAAQKHTALENP